MASTEIRFPGLPDGLNASVNVRDPETLSILETVSLTDGSLYYSGAVTGSLSGQLYFEVLIGTTPIETRIRTIADDDGPYVIDSDLEPRALATADSDQLNAIRAKTDLIGSVTFLIDGGTVTSRGDITIKAGDRHLLTLTSDTEDVVPSLAGVPIRFGIRGNGGSQLLETTSVSVLQPTGLQSVQIELTPSDTISLTQGAAHFDLQAEYGPDDHRTFLTGSVQIKPDYSGTPDP